MTRQRTVGLFLLAVALLMAPSAFAQSTRGDIQGTVTDENGAELVGVTVTLTSPTLQGEQNATTDDKGNFRFPSVPPGIYKAKFALDGFGTIEREAIRVNIGGTVRMTVEMISAFTEEVVVTSERAVVDTTSSTLGVAVNDDFFLQLPVTRQATDIARVAPGAQTDGSGTTFYGSSGAENSYYIDGVNTTGIELGEEGKVLNFEFIQEVQVKTGGYEAEYGRAIGGLVNVVTKSGGNQFQGDVFAYYDDIQNGLSGDAEVGPIAGSRHLKQFTRTDGGVDIGGAFVKDKLWYFAAYNRVDNKNDVEVLKDFASVLPFPDAPSKGDIFPDDTTRDLWAAKLTWSISPSHSFYGSAFGDPSERTGVGPAGSRSLAGTPLHFLGTNTTGGTDQAYNYDGILRQDLIVNARASFHKETSIFDGPGADVPGFIDNVDLLGDGTQIWGFVDPDGTAHEAGFGFWQNNDPLKRDQYNADITWFGGTNELKGGYEFEDLSGEAGRFDGGAGQRIYRLTCDPNTRNCQGSPYYYNHRFFLDSNQLDPTQLTPADVKSPLVSGIKTENDAWYLQDTWRPISNLTIKAGIRWETQALFNHLGQVSGDINDNIAPRFGIIWDPTKNGRSKLFAHYGLFYETIPMDIVIRSFGGEIQIFSYNLSPDPNVVANDPTVRPSRILGGGISRVDPNIEGEYLDELVLGGEWEIKKGLNVGVKYVRRDLKNVIEDALSADGAYFIGNPGKGLMEGTYDLGYAYGYNTTLHQLGVPERNFEGLEFTATKRLTKNFQFLASAVWSQLTGDYDGSFQASTGQLDPNLNSAFDYYDFSVNNEGFLSNDRKWQFKFDGIYRFDVGLTAGFSAHYETGVPITAYGYSVAYANWEYYLSKRGAFGRTDDSYEVDLHLGYPVKVGKSELNLLLDVFNLLDAQTETGRDLHYTNQNDEAYQPIDWVTGVETAIEPGDPSTPPTSAAWNTSNAWTNPRRIRLGVRFSF